MSLLNGPIPFEIPDRFLRDVVNGSLRRIGATLRDNTGRIRAVLQETEWMPTLVQRSLAGAGGGPVGILMSAGQLASSVGANVQLQQVKAMLSTLQLLTGASLAASVVGVGVSAAGFALVLQRLGQMEKKLEQGFAGVRREVIAARLAAEKVGNLMAARDRARTESLLKRAEEAWVRADAEKVWKELDGPLDLEQRYWRGLVGGKATPSIFRDPSFSLEEAVAAYESVLTLASLRIQTLLLLEEHAAALHHAREFHEWHDRVLSGLKSIDVAAARSRQVAEATGVSEPDARTRLLQRSKQFMEGVQEIRLHVADRPAVVQNLIDRGVPGRAYLEALRDRKDVPLVVLPVP